MAFVWCITLFRRYLLYRRELPTKKKKEKENVEKKKSSFSLSVQLVDSLVTKFFLCDFSFSLIALHFCCRPLPSTVNFSFSRLYNKQCVAFDMPTEESRRKILIPFEKRKRVRNKFWIFQNISQMSTKLSRRCWISRQNLKHLITPFVHHVWDCRIVWVFSFELASGKCSEKFVQCSKMRESENLRENENCLSFSSSDSSNFHVVNVVLFGFRLDRMLCSVDIQSRSRKDE